MLRWSHLYCCSLSLLIPTGQDDGCCALWLIGQGVVVIKHVLKCVARRCYDLAAELLLPLIEPVLVAQCLLIWRLQQISSLGMGIRLNGDCRDTV